MRQGLGVHFVTPKFQHEINRLRDLALQLSPYLLALRTEAADKLTMALRARGNARLYEPLCASLVDS